MTDFLSIIKEICTDKGIKVTTISKGWIHVLEKDNIIHYINGYKFDINNSCISYILDDKYAFFELMEHKNYPTINHTILHKNYDKILVEKLFKKYNEQVVIKSNLGTCGREVFYSANLEKVYKIIDKLLISHISVSICPFINIKTEYRVILLESQPVLIYAKKKPIVIGDGKKTIKELLVEFNKQYFLDKDLPNEVLDNGKCYEYNWQFNLSGGATISMEIPQDKKDAICNLASAITNDINARFCSIDIVEDDKNEFYIMEGNSGVMMDNFIKIHPDGYNIAKKIYKNAINIMFNE